MRRFVRWMTRFCLGVLVLLVLVSIAAFFVLRSQWTREKVRLRIIQEVEKATGGTVAMTSFDFDPNTMRVTVKDFVLHGKEPSGDLPLARVSEIRAGLKVVSFMHRDAYLESLEVDRPEIRIVIFPDGSNNIPGPKIQQTGGKSVFELFVAISARKFSITGGQFQYDNRKVPIDLRADNFRINFAWERDGPRYRGMVSAQPFHFNWPKISPLDFDSTVQLTMDKNGLDFQHVEARRGKSLMVATGSLRDYRSPRLDIDVDGQFVMAEYVKPLRLPVLPVGTAHFKGKFTYFDGKYLLEGPFSGTHLAIRQAGIAIDHIDVQSEVRLEPDLVTFAKLNFSALDGEFNGTGRIRRWEALEVKGEVRDLALEELRGVEQRQRPIAWSAAISGPLELSGLITATGIANFAINAKLTLEPEEGRIPLEGSVNFRYRAAGNQLSFDPSHLKTPRTSVNFAGSIEEGFLVRVESRDLSDFLPAAAMVVDPPPLSIPVQLDGGTAHFEGAVSAPLDSPRIQGKLSITKAVYQKQTIDSVSADVEVNSAGLVARQLHVTQNGSEVDGDLQIAMDHWVVSESSGLTAHLNVRKAPIDQLLSGSRFSVPVKGGSFSGPVTIEGTPADPNVTASLNLAGVTLAEETFESIRGNLKYSAGLIEVTNGEAVHRAGRVPFQARYEHSRETWNRGRLTFSVSAKDVQFSAVQTLRKLRDNLDGRIDLEAAADVQIDDAKPVLQSVNGSLALRQFGINKKTLGSLSLSAKTQDALVEVSALGDLMGSPIKGHGEWQISGDANGLGTIELGSFTLAKVSEMLRTTGAVSDIPFVGSFQGEIVVSGALLKPETLIARANLSRLELSPRNDAGQLSAQVMQELTLTNTGPIVLEADSRGLQVAQAQLTGKDTNLQLSGNIATSARNAWNIALRGSLNLGVVQNFVVGLRTSGAAVINATVRGTLDKPLLGGLMQFKDATVYHRDLTNGLDKATGTVIFDRNRALLQNFTANSGGGELRLNGFLTFGGEEHITYRINGQLDHVRIRYPEGASTTVNAALSLTGTADQSLVAGSVTVLRSGFTPRTDIGSLLLEPSRPVQSPSAAILRGMQFDIRVVSAPNLILETSLTQGMQTEVDLKVRGSPSKPVILGTVSVNQGELNFFGTKYNITRGTVSFFNAARIEPVLDLDLETTVRAITVSMNVSGPIDKPNINYRSDPPLQPSDIVALLTVGRTPTGSTVAAQPNVTNSGQGFYAGGETILGQALSSGVSSRLQRFFGVSRVKIDPQLTGIEATPQARLTVEQQISRDITLTYVTNLTGTLQQLVRLQWDARRNWSIVAVRDENGVLGSDILYKKRFK